MAPVTDPLPPAAPPGAVPPPPPALNLKLLWTSLLAPSVVAGIAAVILILVANNSRTMEPLFTIACAVVCLAVLGGWGLFANVLVRRFRGGSLVLLILAYPLLQAILIFAIFFAGCLAMIARVGSY
ncbi:MAG: hypothetical protein HKN82_08290 [Akkermansiaceae bacterium]|nr:hypothetical protein [Akkermansiaceae bacterium]NNM30796.1 hypothetical protein [Akkermansiaceae bacterium]